MTTATITGSISVPSASARSVVIAYREANGGVEQIAATVSPGASGSISAAIGPTGSLYVKEGDNAHPFTGSISVSLANTSSVAGAMVDSHGNTVGSDVASAPAAGPDASGSWTFTGKVGDRFTFSLNA